MKGAVLYGAHQPLVIEELQLLPPQAGEVRVRLVPVESVTVICITSKGTVYAPCRSC